MLVLAGAPHRWVSAEPGDERLPLQKWSETRFKDWWAGQEEQGNVFWAGGAAHGRADVCLAVSSAGRV